MRLWSVHPKYLDRAGLVACWREALLAQAVLCGETRGYRAHPQLERFREAADPVAAVGAFLSGLHAESLARGYRFDASRIREQCTLDGAVPVTDGQLMLERDHLEAKLAMRDPESLEKLPTTPTLLEPHPLFRVVSGPSASWERATPRQLREPSPGGAR